MAVNLRKGQGVSLKKSENDLSLVTIGLGWDVAEEYTIVRKVVERNKPKVLGLFGGGTEQVIIEEKELVEYDLDVVAFLVVVFLTTFSSLFSLILFNLLSFNLFYKLYFSFSNSLNSMIILII
jgi:stress response protein SCP2